jgi:hypothetical protein
MKSWIASLLLAGLLSTGVHASLPADAARMNNDNQSVISYQYGLLKDANKIVVKNQSQTLQVIDDPSQIRSVVQFFQQRQFDWHRPWFSNRAPWGSYALTFYLVEDPLVTFGLAKREVNFRNDGQSFACTLQEEDAQQLSRLLGVSFPEK